MSSKNIGLSHKTDYALSVGDSVCYAAFACRVVGLTSKLVYLVTLSSFHLPYGLVFCVPFSDVCRFAVGERVSFRVNGDRVVGLIKSYDCFGQAVVKVSPDFLVGNSIRIYHVPVHSLESLPF